MWVYGVVECARIQLTWLDVLKDEVRYRQLNLVEPLAILLFESSP